jgi:hypothetical protein
MRGGLQIIFAEEIRSGILSFTCESRRRRCDPLEFDWRDASVVLALAELG